MRAASGVGQGAVFSGAVVAALVGTDELVTDRDLHGVADDGDLDLSTTICGSDPIVGPGETHVAGAVDLAGH
jgi:hypothetical protein